MSHKGRPFSADQLPELLAQLPGGTNYRVAFSGGADSTALLQAMSEIAASSSLTVSALHVNHGLHPHSGQWQSRCEQFCKERGIPLECRQVFPARSGGVNLEAEARRMRYGEAESLLGPGEVLLTGHHLEDQAETLLLNLLRGSGVDGLAGMPVARPLGRGWLARPLLRQSRASLQAFLRNRGIDWIEDPSNLDPGSDRNHIRHTIMPALDHRWPGASTRLARSTRHCREIADLMIDEADRLLPAFLDAEPVFSLRRDGLLDDARLKWLLRQWLRRNQAPALPHRRLRELLQQLHTDSPGKAIRAAWSGWQLRCHRNRLWLLGPGVDQPCRAAGWGQSGNLDMGPSIGEMALTGLRDTWPDGLSVKSRSGGETILISGHSQHKKIKHLFQELAVPPWLRQTIPLLWWGNEPAAVGDWYVSRHLQAHLTRHEASLVWRPRHPVLRYLHKTCSPEKIKMPAPVEGTG